MKVKEQSVSPSVNEERYRLLFQTVPISIWHLNFSNLEQWLEQLRSRGIENLSDYLKQNPDEVKLAARKLEINEVNQATLELIGASSTEQIIADRLQLFDEGAYLFVSKMLIAIWNGECRFKAESEMTTLDGRRMNVFFDVLIPDTDGQRDFSNVIITLVDITELKKAEKKKTELEEQIRELQKMEAIGTLAGGIAHDFNNILAPIVGYTEMSIDALPDIGEVRANLEQVRKAAARAKSLIKQIFIFSQEADAELTLVKTQDVIKDAAEFFRASFPATINIEQRIDEKVGPLEADSSQLHQMLLNLGTNAFHAMKTNGGTLTLGLERVNIGADHPLVEQGEIERGGYARISVKDTGEGITRDIKDRIFEPYFTTREMGQGTGLGLSIVHGIVKNHRGTIFVMSEPGRGSLFEVLLPLADQSIIDRSRLSDDIRGNESVLVIDDEDMIVDVISRALKKYGYRVVAQTDPTSARELFKSDPTAFDIVITDQTMPHITGSQLIQEFRVMRPDLPIILCTGYSEEVGREGALALGAREYLLKPIVPKNVVEVVRRVLDGN